MRSNAQEAQRKLNTIPQAHANRIALAQSALRPLPLIQLLAEGVYELGELGVREGERAICGRS